MDRHEIVQVVLHHYQGLFPRTCTKCGVQFATLKDYIQATERLGSVQSFDIEMGEWQPSRPVGTLAFSNCTCGTTIALSSDGLPVPTRHGILAWVKEESGGRKVSPSVVLDELRAEIRRLALTSSS